MEIVMSEKEILKACKRIGKQISKDLKNEDRVPLILGVMKGGLPFMMDMIKYITIPVFTDFIQVSSYSGTERGNEVKLVKDITYDIENRTIILVDDIVDSGNSISYLINHLKKTYNPKQILTCVLFDKINARITPVNIDYAGNILEENKFLCGYGLDYKELYRNIPYVFVPTPEEIAAEDEYLNKKA